MDIFNILSYINKLSLIAFVITLAVLVYQFYLLKKDFGKRKTPVIPDFDESITAPAVNYTKLEIAKVKDNPGVDSKLLILVIVTAFVAVVLALAILIKGKTREQPVVEAEPLTKLVASKGIKIYDDLWRELKEEVATLSAGTEIIIGLDVPPEIDNIDKARIRVNKSTWSPEDENLKFDKTKHLYYRTYTVATEARFIKAEGQFHSTTDGWLGQ